MNRYPLDLSRFAPPPRLETEICIIGSGCGGATAARVLAEAGKDVVVLEEGGDMTGRELQIPETRRYDQLYMDRGGRMTKDMSISVLQGRTLGGGGVINASDVVPMTDELLDFWNQRFGLSEFTPANLSSSLAAALDDLSVNPILESQVNRANSLLRQGAEALGFKGEVLRHNRVGCQGLGQCLLGCPANAKRNPRLVSIPRAIQAGALVYLRARATCIRAATSAMKKITVRTLDPLGYKELGEFEIRAKVVILAANGVNSAQLLLRSGIGNDHVGKYLTLQPQLPILAEFHERVEGFYGIPQAYAVTEFEEPCHKQYGMWGFRIEAVMGTPGLVSSMLPLAGLPGKQMMVAYPNIAAALLLVPDEPSGTVSLQKNSPRPIISYEHRENHKQRLRQAIREAARIYLEAGAKRVLVPLIPPLEVRSLQDLKEVEKLDFPTATAPLVSAHQQGSVRFSPSPDLGGASPEGEVWGTKSIYVFDSSGFPTSASSHTMAPIITFSHYLSKNLLTHL